MLNEKELKEIAEKYLDTFRDEVDCVLNESFLIEKEYGNIYSYYPRYVLENPDKEYAFAGIAPFLVKKSNGQVVVFGTALAIEDYLEGYESGLWEPIEVYDNL